MKADYVTQRAVAGLVFDDPAAWSTVNVKRLVFYIVSVAIWTLENLFDLHKAEVLAIIAATEPHTLQWYAQAASAFQYGFNLLPDSALYNNALATAAQITASKVVAYSAVTEQTRGLRIKVATLNGSDLDALTAPELASFVVYMQRIKDAGVKLLITTGVADSLMLGLTVKYNPLVLDASGQRLDGTYNTPVQDAVFAYLKSLPFNGKMELVTLVNMLETVDGVDAPYVANAAARYGSLPFTAFVDNVYIPDSGYLRLYNPSDLAITWEANI